MHMERITKSRLALTLDNAIRTSVGIRGLNTLIYGWLNLRHYGPKYRNAIYNRDWLYVSEVQDLSDYAGYDLLTGQRLPDPYLCTVFRLPLQRICLSRLTQDGRKTRARRRQKRIESRLTRDLFVRKGTIVTIKP